MLLLLMMEKAGWQVVWREAPGTGGEKEESYRVCGVQASGHRH
jgi:hypothetical protein